MKEEWVGWTDVLQEGGRTEIGSMYKVTFYYIHITIVALETH